MALYIVITILSFAYAIFTLREPSSTFTLVLQILAKGGLLAVFMCSVLYYLRYITEYLEEIWEKLMKGK